MRHVAAEVARTRPPCPDGIPRASPADPWSAIHRPASSTLRSGSPGSPVARRALGWLTVAHLLWAASGMYVLVRGRARAGWRRPWPPAVSRSRRTCWPRLRGALPAHLVGELVSLGVLGLRSWRNGRIGGARACPDPGTGLPDRPSPGVVLPGGRAEALGAGRRRAGRPARPVPRRAGDGRGSGRLVAVGPAVWRRSSCFPTWPRRRGRCAAAGWRSAR